MSFTTVRRQCTARWRSSLTLTLPLSLNYHHTVEVEEKKARVLESVVTEKKPPQILTEAKAVALECKALATMPEGVRKEVTETPVLPLPELWPSGKAVRSKVAISRLETALREAPAPRHVSSNVKSLALISQPVRNVCSPAMPVLISFPKFFSPVP